MGSEYKKELLQRYGLNPDATSRDWEDEEHEILALMLDNKFDHLSDKIDENEKMLSNHEAMLQEHDDFILKRRKAMEEQEREEELGVTRSQAKWEKYGAITAAVLMFIGWILSGLGLL